MSKVPNPILMGLSDVLDGTTDWLNGQNESVRGLLGGHATGKFDSWRELKLSECLKELASFQRSVLEELPEENPLLPKDLSSTLLKAGLTQSVREKEIESVSSELKNARRREVKDIQQKPWSFSTKSSSRSSNAGLGKGDRMLRLSKKSPVGTAKPRQYVVHSNPLASDRRLSATSSKKRESLDQSPTNCRRMSNSPSFKAKSAERMKNGFGVQGSNLAGKMKALERTPASKAAKLTDRQKMLLKRVMNSPTSTPVTGLKRIQRDKAGVLAASVDLSAAARRARRLSQVLRSEHEIKHQNQQYAKELQDLRRQYAIKEEEADRAQSAGMLLRQVCVNQAEELKAYKGAFPTLMKDMADLRENFYKQEKELQTELNLRLSLEAEGSELRNRVECLTNDIKQTRTLNTVLADRVHQYEKSQCTSCRLHINQKSVKKEVTLLSAKKKAVQPFRTPQRPRSDSNLVRNSPMTRSSMKKLENVYQQENVKPPLRGVAEAVQNDSVLQARCENMSQGLSNAEALQSRRKPSLHWDDSMATMQQIAASSLKGLIFKSLDQSGTKTRGDKGIPELGKASSTQRKSMPTRSTELRKFDKAEVSTGVCYLSWASLNYFPELSVDYCDHDSKCRVFARNIQLALSVESTSFSSVFFVSLPDLDKEGNLGSMTSLLEDLHLESSKR